MAEIPPNIVGSGSVAAVNVLVVRFRPKTVAMEPGAKPPDWNVAELTTELMMGPRFSVTGIVSGLLDASVEVIEILPV